MTANTLSEPTTIAITVMIGLGVLGSIILLIGLVEFGSAEAAHLRMKYCAIVALAAGFAIAAMRTVSHLRSRSLRPLRPFIRHLLSGLAGLSKLEKFLIAGCAVCALNVILGALAPDTSQDSQWYHLSVARAWLQWGRTFAWPYVFPSNTALHQSAIYSAVLSIGNEIDCSVLYAAEGFLCHFTTSYFAARWYGRAAGIWAWFLVATAMATNCWFVPIHTGNDLTVAMFSTAGLLLGIDLLFPNSDDLLPHKRSSFILPNVLIGFAVASKITALGYAFAPWLLLCAWGLVKRPAMRAAIVTSLPLALLPFACWGVRSVLLGCGNPLFPLLREQWPLRAEFEPLRKYAAVNSLYPFNLQGLLLAAAHAGEKLQFAVMAGSAGFILHAGSILGFTARDSKLRCIALISLVQWIVLFWTAGFSETIRYFAPFFPVAFVAVAAALAKLGQQSARPALPQVALAAVALVLFSSYAQKQWNWSRIPNIGRSYRPVLTREDRATYIARHDYGLDNYPLYDWMNKHLPAQSTILFGDTSYPFYVDRKYIWADPEINIMHEFSSDPPALTARLQSTPINYVLATPTDAAAAPWGSILSPVSDAPTPAGLRLYTVH